MTSNVQSAQYELAVFIVRSLARGLAAVGREEVRGKYRAGDVLIFVSGMADIEEITQRLERLNETSTAVRYEVIPIHSLIPEAEQQRAFARGKGVGVGEGEGGEEEEEEEEEEEDTRPAVRVIISTNSGESSLTFGGCDHVIDLGTHKELRLNDRTRRQVGVETPTRWCCVASLAISPLPISSDLTFPARRTFLELS